jgi:hypothetical protein
MSDQQELVTDELRLLHRQAKGNAAGDHAPQTAPQGSAHPVWSAIMSAWHAELALRQELIFAPSDQPIQRFRPRGFKGRLCAHDRSLLRNHRDLWREIASV